MPGTRFASYLRKHPVLCLLLLTPGIPEYLSGSSPLNAIVLNPGGFFFQLVANLGLYGPGVLLVREAKVRWKKGWATVLALGAAYGILEEGVALSTLFNPNAGPVGALGTYGHWVGVNWVWVAAIVPVHMIFSISIPIMILGLALPSTVGREFLGGRKLAAAIVILSADVALLFVLIVKGVGFWMGWPVLLGSFGAIAALVLLGRRLEPRAIKARGSNPNAGPWKLALVGVVFYPCVLLSQGLAEGAGVPASIDFFLVILVQGLFLLYVVRIIGSSGSERNRIVFAFGLIVPIAAIGVIAEATLPLNLIADAVWIVAFRKVWRNYPSQALPPEAPAVPS